MTRRHKSAYVRVRGICRSALGSLLLLACAQVGAQTNAGEEDAPESKSNYAETVPVGGGAQTVAADLVAADTHKNVLFDVDWIHSQFPNFYSKKESVNSKLGIALNADYSILTQHASFSATEQDAASSVFRIYGNWLAVGDKNEGSGNLVFKYEYRGAIWGRPAPRDMGFDTGSALSTANYKQSGWGWTDLYWKQLFGSGSSMLLVGHMDPGDWADQHVLLNAWTNLTNDAFYNNPAEAIPKRTFSVVGRFGLPNDWYLAGGVHDSNGRDNHIDFRQVWDTPELFTWFEVGFRPNEYSKFGETTHLHYWHQDTREQAGTEGSWGVNLSSSRVFDSGFTAVFRAGYSEGDAPQMRNFIGIAASWPMRGSDTLLLGTSWGSPPDKTPQSQVTSEIIYRLNVTQNLTVSPDLQITINPSFNETENVIYVVGLRARWSF